MQRQPIPAISCSSGAPWNVSCDVERVGRDYLCRIHGGDLHIGAVALSQWRFGRAVTECLTVAEHKEGGIAVHAAHTLCTASRRGVCCIAGIHFDAVTKEETSEILQMAYALIGKVARELEDRRVRENLDLPSADREQPPPE
ncbi:MAG: hypothetical protein ACE5KS_09645 [Woeseiaceae bacterium]